MWFYQNTSYREHTTCHLSMKDEEKDAELLKTKSAEYRCSATAIILLSLYCRAIAFPSPLPSEQGITRLQYFNSSMFMSLFPFLFIFIFTLTTFSWLFFFKCLSLLELSCDVLLNTVLFITLKCLALTEGCIRVGMDQT